MTRRAPGGQRLGGHLAGAVGVEPALLLEQEGPRDWLERIASTVSVALGGGPAAAVAVRFAGAPKLGDAGLTVKVRAGGPGTLRVFAAGPDGRAVAARTVTVWHAGTIAVQVALDDAARAALADGGYALASLEDGAGGTRGLSARLPG